MSSGHLQILIEAEATIISTDLATDCRVLQRFYPCKHRVQYDLGNVLKLYTSGYMHVVLNWVRNGGFGTLTLVAQKRFLSVLKYFRIAG